MDSDGQPGDPEGEPDLVLEVERKVKLRLRKGDQTRYLDLLALESGLLGEHPVHKVFRLQAMGVPLDDGLAEKLKPGRFADNLFHSVTFQYLQHKEPSGVVAEVFPDGTFLAIPFDLPSEWYGEQTATEANLLDIQPGTRIIAERAFSKSSWRPAKVLALFWAHPCPWMTAAELRPTMAFPRLSYRPHSRFLA